MQGLGIVTRRTTVDNATDEIRAWIMRGDIAPGERITEVALAKQLGVGRSTVRIALLELQNEEIVVLKPYSAWAVAELTEEDISENYTLREALECLAIKVLTEKLGDVQRAALAQAFKRLEDAENGVGGVDRATADLNFHLTIVKQSGHRRLVKTYELLFNKIEWIYRWSEKKSPATINLIEWHRPILEAILAGNAQEACKALRNNYEFAAQGDLSKLVPDDSRK